MAFQDLQSGQIISNVDVASALSAGVIVKLGTTGWALADDETVAKGILMIDVVAAPTADASGVGDIYDGGVVEAPAKIYVGNPGPVDTGDPVCLVPDPVSTFHVGDAVYVGNGLLYDSAQNSGSSVGTVLEVNTDSVMVRFKFPA